jgi:hypothetical protein
MFVSLSFVEWYVLHILYCIIEDGTHVNQVVGENQLNLKKTTYRHAYKYLSANDDSFTWLIGSQYQHPWYTQKMKHLAKFDCHIFTQVINLIDLIYIVFFRNSNTQNYAHI